MQTWGAAKHCLEEVQVLRMRCYTGNEGEVTPARKKSVYKDHV